MELLTGIFTAFGLSASAGLNAYIPLLMVALLGRYTNLMHLTAPWDTLTNPWIILLLCILVILEMLADKLPAVNHLNDAIQTFVRPVAGAIVFAASANVISDIHPVLALAAGVLVAGTVHVAKAGALRPAAVTGIIGPSVSGTFLIVIAAFLIFWLYKRSNRKMTSG